MIYIKIQLQNGGQAVFECNTVLCPLCMDRSKTIIYNVYTQIDLSVAIYFGDLFHDHYIYLPCNWMNN